MAKRKSAAAKKYTRPGLRQRIKDELMESSKGGRRGEWSARKSQLLVTEYERRGGGYKRDANRAEARALHKWTEQDWQTRGGRAKARGGRTMRRYLPAEAWRRLSPQQRARAERTKRETERAGGHHARWPAAVERVMHDLEQERGRGAATKADLYVRAKQHGIRGRSKMSKRALRRAVARAEQRGSR